MLAPPAPDLLLSELPHKIPSIPNNPYEYTGLTGK